MVGRSRLETIKTVDILKYPPARISLMILETMKIVTILKCLPERILLIILEGIQI